VTGPAGVRLLRTGPAVAAGTNGADVVRRVPLRVGDRVVVSVRLLAPDGAVLAASRGYTWAPRGRALRARSVSDPHATGPER